MLAVDRNSHNEFEVFHDAPDAVARAAPRPRVRRGPRGAHATKYVLCWDAPLAPPIRDHLG